MNAIMRPNRGSAGSSTLASVPCDVDSTRSRWQNAMRATIPSPGGAIGTPSGIGAEPRRIDARGGVEHQRHPVIGPRGGGGVSGELRAARQRRVGVQHAALHGGDDGPFNAELRCVERVAADDGIEGLPAGGEAELGGRIESALRNRTHGRLACCGGQRRPAPRAPGVYVSFCAPSIVCLRSQYARADRGGPQWRAVELPVSEIRYPII